MTMAEVRGVVRGLVELHRLRQHPSALLGQEQNRHKAIDLWSGYRHGVPLHSKARAVGTPVRVDPITVKESAATQAWSVAPAHRWMNEVQDLHLLDRCLGNGDYRDCVNCAQHDERCLALRSLAALRPPVAAPIAHNRGRADNLDLQHILLLRHTHNLGATLKVLSRN